jgi:hypothetical protein
MTLSSFSTAFRRYPGIPVRIAQRDALLCGIGYLWDQGEEDPYQARRR